MSAAIRPAVPEDAAALARLNREEMGYDFPEEDTRRQLEKLLTDKSNRIYVAESDGVVIGYVHANDYDLIYAPHMKNIMGIAVSSAFRKSGVGRLLLGAVEQWAAETGACGVRLVSGASRTGAHEFYRACGYQETKEQKNFKKFIAG